MMQRPDKQTGAAPESPRVPAAVRGVLWAGVCG